MKKIFKFYATIIGLCLSFACRVDGAEFFRFGCYYSNDTIIISHVSADGRVLFGHIRNGDLIRWTPSEGLTTLGKPEGIEGNIFLESVSTNGETIRGYASSQKNIDYDVEFTWSRGLGYNLNYNFNADAINDHYLNDNDPRKKLIEPPSAYDNVTIRGNSPDGSVLLGDFSRRTNQQCYTIGFAWRKDVGVRKLRDKSGAIFSYASDMTEDQSTIFGRAVFSAGSISDVNTMSNGAVAAVWEKGSMIRPFADVLAEYGIDTGDLELHGIIDASDNGSVIVAVGKTENCVYETCVAYLSKADDSDRDELLDTWEFAYFGGLASNPEDDPDGDGLTNLEEVRMKTNPAVTDAVPFAVDMKCGDNICVVVSSSTNWLYTLQYSEHLIGDLWHDVGNQKRLAGTDGNISLEDNQSRGSGFYRVVAEKKIHTSTAPN